MCIVVLNPENAQRTAIPAVTTPCSLQKSLVSSMSIDSMLGKRGVRRVKDFPVEQWFKPIQVKSAILLRLALELV